MFRFVAGRFIEKSGEVFGIMIAAMIVAVIAFEVVRPVVGA